MQRRVVRLALSAGLLMGFALGSAPAVAAQQVPFDLSLTMTGPTRIHSTQDYSYLVTVTNLGPGTATNLSIVGGMFDQFNAVSMRCLDNGSTGSAGCNPNDLPSGASVQAIFTVNVCCLVRHENRHADLSATVIDRDGNALDDPNLDNNTMSLTVFIIGKQVH
jgi:uncharacterized protein DUF11